jgi:hypothetical protein
MTDYPIHLDTQSSKETVCSKKGYGYKWTWQTIHCDCEMQNSNKSTVPLLDFVSKCNVG